MQNNFFFHSFCLLVKCLDSHIHVFEMKCNNFGVHVSSSAIIRSKFESQIF